MDHQPGLKIIRPTAIRTNFSDGLGLPKLGLGQDRVPEKFSSQVLDFWLQKEPKVGLGTKQIDFSPWILGFIFGYIKPSLDNVPISLVVE